MSTRRIKGGLAPLLAVAAGIAFTGTASAQTGNPFGCSASTAAVTLAGQSVLPGAASANPGDVPCASASASLGQTPVSTIPGLSLSVGPVSAQTTLGTSSVSGSTVYTGATSTSTLNALNLNLVGLAISVTTPSQATADYECVNNQLVTSTSSTLNAITINGSTMSLNGLPQNLSIPGVATILVNQHAVTADSDTETLLQVQLLGIIGNGLMLNVGSATASMPQTGGCANTTPTPIPMPTPTPNPTPAPNPTPSPNPNPGPDPSPTPSGGCPVGTTYDSSIGACVLAGSGSTANPITVVSPGSQDIVGGSVISLVRARRLYPTAHCLRGTGPRFVVVGTKGANKITLSKRRFRVLGLGGKDTITVKGGNGTCVDGGAGNDRIVNRGSNKVFAYGSAGRDHITLGNGPAYVRGGAGNDVIKAGNGALKVFGGAGNDVITAGTGRDVINGGTGKNRITARGKWAHVSAGEGKSVAYVRAGNRAYARRHGIARVHVIS